MIASFPGEPHGRSGFLCHPQKRGKSRQTPATPTGFPKSRVHAFCKGQDRFFNGFRDFLSQGLVLHGILGSLFFFF
jgi:hypothetical protein